MQGLYDSGDGFLGTCIDLMGRMINTVPSGVELGAAVEPMGVKPVNVTFDIDGQGGLVLSGKIRVRRPPNLLVSDRANTTPPRYSTPQVTPPCLCRPSWLRTTAIQSQSP